MEVAKLVAADGAAVDYFGWSVAIEGATVVVGSPEDDDGGSASGSAYVFRTTDGWTTHDQVAKLTAADAAADDEFGYSVAINGNAIVAGARQYWPISGHAYIFGTNDDGATYSQVAKASCQSGCSYLDAFGESVGISNDTVVIGGSGANQGNSGAAFVFRTTDGDQVAKLKGSPAQANDWCGISVAIDGNRIVFGCPGEDDGGAQSGAAYVFHTSDSGATYDRVAKLTASDAGANDKFGQTVAIDGDTVVVASRYDDDGGSNSGSVYVFRTTDGGATYVELAKLMASDGAAGDNFGMSVAIDGGIVVVWGLLRIQQR